MTLRFRCGWFCLYRQSQHTSLLRPVVTQTDVSSSFSWYRPSAVYKDVLDMQGIYNANSRNKCRSEIVDHMSEGNIIL